jgi:phosphoglycerate dehydrogenase-like enzyme
VEITSAGYTRYDTEVFLGGFRARGSVFTNACGVFADPCAQHLLAMLLAFGRQLLPSYRDQLTDQSWHYTERRYDSRLLTGQTVVLLGYGAIGRRFVELLAPFRVKVYALRRTGRPETAVEVIREADLPRVLALADHVVNILPAHPSTDGYVDAARLAMCRPGARFYNVGRGSTVDQAALEGALRAGGLAAAYLDVMEPEPLPPGHSLWSAPNCYITPHTAGGRHDQDEALVGHFLKNLAAFEGGGSFTDRVV